MRAVRKKSRRLHRRPAAVLGCTGNMRNVVFHPPAGNQVAGAPTMLMTSFIFAPWPTSVPRKKDFLPITSSSGPASSKSSRSPEEALMTSAGAELRQSNYYMITASTATLLYHFQKLRQSNHYTIAASAATLLYHFHG